MCQGQINPNRKSSRLLFFMCQIWDEVRRMETDSSCPSIELQWKYIGPVCFNNNVTCFQYWWKFHIFVSMVCKSSTSSNCVMPNQWYLIFMCWCIWDSILIMEKNLKKIKWLNWNKTFFGKFKYLVNYLCFIYVDFMSSSTIHCPIPPLLPLLSTVY
jgi:hypothetical protein